MSSNMTGTGGEAQSAATVPRGGWLAAWAALVAAGLWLATPSTLPILLLSGAVLGWTLAAKRSGSRVALASALLLWGVVATAGFTQVRLHEHAAHWPQVRDEIRERAAETLRAELDAVVDRGEEAVAGIQAAYGESGGDRRRLFHELAAVRAGSAVTAVSVHARDGSPIAWAGTHRGTVPEPVSRGMRPYVYEEGALFGHLYFSHSLPDGRTGVAAILLQSEVAVDDTRSVAEGFQRRHGVLPTFSTPDRARGEVVWDWTADEPILSVAFAPVTEAAWRERTLRSGRGLAGLLTLLAALLMVGFSIRNRPGYPAATLAVAGVAVLLAPLGEILGARGLFSPLGFLLPLPGRVTLGDLLVVLGLLGVVVAGAPAAAPARGWWIWAPRFLLIAAWLPIAPLLLLEGASEPLLTRPPGGSPGLLLAGVLLAGLPIALALGTLSDRRPGRRGLPWAVVGALASVILGTMIVLSWVPGRAVPVLALAAGVVPAVCFWAGGGVWGRPGWKRRLGAWLVAAWIAGSLVPPLLYTAHLEARTAAAERELARLGTAADPYADFLLRQFASEAERAAGEEEGVRLLFRAWVASGMSAAGYEAWMALLEEGEVTAELRFADALPPPDLLAGAWGSAIETRERTVQRFIDREAVHYLMAAPLAGNRVVVGSLPPQRRIARPGLLSAFLDPARADDPEGPYGPLRLIPAIEGGAHEHDMAWRRTAAGWRSEVDAPFPDGPMHVHLEVRTASPVLLAARGVLVLAGSLALFAGLLGLGFVLRGGLRSPLRVRRFWLGSFRSRLTVALFIFFLLPTAGFGAVAYETLTREVRRAATVLAARAVDQAAREAPLARLADLGERIDSELLLYRRGVLVEAASPEALDLGLYPTWISPDVYLRFMDGDEVEAIDESRLAGRDLLTAYRRSGAAEILAAPTPLAMGEMERRQQEFADLLLFFGLLGGLFSVALALLVSRALSRPIERLSRAAVAVGRGDLDVRLPEGRRDEFGELQTAFNRMVRRLKRGRRELVREKRRTETIVETAAAGVVALDSRGRVTVANPEAAAVLGEPVVRGRPLPARTPLMRDVAGRIEAFRRGTAEEQGVEVEREGRTVKVRLRRLVARGRAAGVVVALEDITSDIRSARVLAWGEMARQVAHEIKNPLTPIKLSVQHLRRAYRDPRVDYEVVLEENVGAVLREIDRLSEIARSFSRFGSPGEPGAALEVVDLGAVVEETLALYRAGHEAIEYAADVPAPLLPVQARVGELKEVLVNLLENSREALGDAGGRVEVRARGTGDRVRLEVVDDGPGIDPEGLEQVFQPHFSTRSSGTGLGLAIVRRLVESWGSEVWAESDGRGGTTIVLDLLAVGDPPA
jgi:two-component system, NtrC family, nitrogen regulation sensor histidine kinase NtrY